MVEDEVVAVGEAEEVTAEVVAVEEVEVVTADPEFLRFRKI
ncbi:hypothetical protein LEP1GSC060_3153 [Leptospira weilii serovar Ranarum str. ICFT]|uniref:Uncharacterized protein n=1 Tax=Leptospira weilii serovar Ranarum str. ICFT TaxID=1218598 RepID=N1WI58_9LEPT|nr:hypothetical protein LEP1GSC060_3153 [Leptospira weilii serovar Ranarum str. ICFT]